MNEGQIIGLSIKDFFTKPMLKIAFLPLIITIIIMLVLFYSAAGYGFTSLHEFVIQTQNGQDVLVDPNAPFYFVWMTSVLSFLFHYSITSWLVGFLFYTIGTIFIIMFSVFLTIIIIGFLTPQILKNLHKKHYSHLKLNSFSDSFTSIWVLIKSFIIMVFLFIVFIPLYFIPLINVFAINFPIYYFFHKLLVFDVSSNILSKEEFFVIQGKNAMTFRFRTLFLYLLSLIPSLMLFSAVFYIIYLGHCYFIELQKERGLKIQGLDD